jgi:hypothetical protein
MPEERDIIETLARSRKIKPEDFTPQFINLALKQARYIGDLN